MKRIIILMCIVLLASCESAEDKNSRLTLDKYARKINSLMDNVVDSRTEEGNQSKLTMSNFYQRYTSRIEDFKNDLSFESISPKYTSNKDDLIKIATNVNNYINARRITINAMIDTYSAYNNLISYNLEYNEYKMKYKTSQYSREFYLDMIIDRLEKLAESGTEFIQNKSVYEKSIMLIDSIYKTLDSISANYNYKVNENKLVDSVLLPNNFVDTINDWVYSKKQDILSLQLPEIEK